MEFVQAFLFGNYTQTRALVQSWIQWYHNIIKIEFTKYETFEIWKWYIEYFMMCQTYCDVP